MKIPKIGFAVLGLLLLGIVLWQGADPRTGLLLTQASGSITTGSLLEISVGDKADQAVARLRALGFESPAYYPGGDDLYPEGRMILDPTDRNRFVQVLPSQTVISLRDRSWRNGSVELIEDRGHVVRITWWFSPFAINI